MSVNGNTANDPWKWHREHGHYISDMSAVEMFGKSREVYIITDKVIEQRQTKFFTIVSLVMLAICVILTVVFVLRQYNII